MATIAIDTKQKDDALDLSVQRRADIKASGGMVFPWWFVSSDEYEIAPWWSEQRDRDLRTFVRREGNDILQGAISSLVKKFKAMAWALDGPQRVIGRYQDGLARAEFGQGWSTLLSKVLFDYLTQDKGAFIEVIGRGDPLGPIEGPAVSLAHLDAGMCQVTGDPVYPVLYNNPKDGLPHKLHAGRVIRLVDMPSPNEEMLGIGFCGVSRVIASSSVLLKLSQYKNEKLSDLPQAGLLLLNNIMPAQWEDVTSGHERGRRKLNHEIWSNIITLIGIDPAQQVSAEFLSFANLPDAFNEQEATTIYVNILALAFGVDAREFWPISSGALGTAAEAETMHQKAKGKGVGEIISQLERAINWQFLPPSVTFRFDFRDDEEDQLRAEINRTKVETIVKMWIPGDPATGVPTPVSEFEIRQMLADNVPDYFKQEFLEVDMTEEEELTDTDQEVEKAYGQKASVDDMGRLKASRRRWLSGARGDLNEVVALAERNYRDGKISLDELLEFRLGTMVDGKHLQGQHD